MVNEIKCRDCYIKLNQAVETPAQNILKLKQFYLPNWQSCVILIFLYVLDDVILKKHVKFN